MPLRGGVHPIEAPLAERLGQRGQHRGGRREEHPIASLDGLEPESHGQMRFPDPGQASGILLHIRVNEGPFTTAFTHARAPKLRWYAGVVRPIWWSVNRTGPSPVFPSG